MINNMKLVTKTEAFALRKQGLQDYVLMSRSNHPKYYIVEDEKALNALDKYRKSKIVKEYK